MSNRCQGVLQGLVDYIILYIISDIQFQLVELFPPVATPYSHPILSLFMRLTDMATC